MSNYIAENNRIGFVRYTHDDDMDMLACWQDHDTQKGYNHVFGGCLENLNSIEIAAFPFWVVVVDKTSGAKIGVLRLSGGESPDLAIWIYPGYRGKGFGTEAFSLAADYIFRKLKLRRIYAGCYCDNGASLRMLEKADFIRFPAGDQQEENCFTGKPTTQLSFVRTMLDGMIYGSIIRRDPVEKGWSGDAKYCAWTAAGDRYLLRISPVQRRERKLREFEKMNEVAALGIPMCQPLEIGDCDEGVYSIQSWIAGVDAEEAVAAMPEQRQYAYGRDAGRILRKIHTLPAPADAPDWETRFNAKIDRKIAMYEACPLKYEKDQPFLDFIRENRHLLAGRPQTYQHGDYHIGNMMIDANGVLTIIDFDRDDFGDPWEEFNRIVWCAQAAPAFARGMVDGYFGGEVPMEFWRLLALYICSNTLSSLPWAVSFGEGEVATMRVQAAQVLEWYDDMKNAVPAWYREA